MKEALHKAFEWLRKHPAIAGACVFFVGLLVFLYFRSGSSSSSTGTTVLTAAGQSDAVTIAGINAGAAVQAAQLQSQTTLGLAGAQYGSANTIAGLAYGSQDTANKLNSENVANTLAAQIAANRDTIAGQVAISAQTAQTQNNAIAADLAKTVAILNEQGDANALQAETAQYTAALGSATAIELGRQNLVAQGMVIDSQNASNALMANLQSQYIAADAYKTGQIIDLQKYIVGSDAAVSMHNTDTIANSNVALAKINADQTVSVAGISAVAQTSIAKTMAKASTSNALIGAVSSLGGAAINKFG